MGSGGANFSCQETSNERHDIVNSAKLLEPHTQLLSPHVLGSLPSVKKHGFTCQHSPQLHLWYVLCQLIGMTVNASVVSSSIRDPELLSFLQDGNFVGHCINSWNMMCLSMVKLRPVALCLEDSRFHQLFDSFVEFLCPCCK